MEWAPSYHQIGGLQPVIELLRREIELPLRRARDLAALGIRTPDGCCYGLRGTGKTTLARAVGEHSGAHVTFLSGGELVSLPSAECEETLRAAFRGTEQADIEESADPPRLVIVDDLDFLAPDRNRLGVSIDLLGLLLRLLVEPGRPVVLATTSRRDAINPALRRLGRIGGQVAVPVPGEQNRNEILDTQTRWLPMSTTEAVRDELLVRLARRTVEFVGADLEALCRQAGSLALRRAFPIEVLESDRSEAKATLDIRDGDWEEALTLVTPSAIDGDVSDVPPTTLTT